MRRRISTHPTLKRDSLACYAALEGAQDELIWCGGVEDVEAGPVYAAQWRRKRLKTVPKEGGRVGCVAGVLVR